MKSHDELDIKSQSQSATYLGYNIIYLLGQRWSLLQQTLGVTLQDPDVMWQQIRTD